MTAIETLNAFVAQVESFRPSATRMVDRMSLTALTAACKKYDVPNKMSLIDELCRRMALNTK